MKSVKVRGNKHRVVPLNAQDESTFVDLGPVQPLKEFDFAKGDRISVTGPMMKTGNKMVLLARNIDAQGQTLQVDREKRSIKGKVTKIHRVKIRGFKNTIAIVKYDQAQKVAVDLGPTKNIESDIKDGSNLSFTGIPVNVTE